MKLWILFTVLALFSCQSVVKNKTVNSAGGEEQKILQNLDEKIIDFQISPETKVPIETRKAVEDALLKETLNKDYKAYVNSAMGEINYADGNIEAAKQNLQAADRFNPAGERNTVLRARLSNDPAKKRAILEKALKSRPDSGLILLEKGLLDYQEADYADAAASLDEAISLLPPVYKSAYSSTRDTAFRLKNTSKTGASLALTAQILTVEGMIDITLTSSDFLKIYQNDSIKTTYTNLVQAGYFYRAAPALSDKADRKTAAFFLYHILFIKTADTKMLSSYSSAYSNQASPVPDLNPADQWFDAALGLTEREIMELPDGVNFSPDKTLSGSDYQSILTKLKKYGR